MFSHLATVQVDRGKDNNLHRTCARSDSPRTWLRGFASSTRQTKATARTSSRFSTGHFTSGLPSKTSPVSASLISRYFLDSLAPLAFGLKPSADFSPFYSVRKPGEIARPPAKVLPYPNTMILSDCRWRYDFPSSWQYLHACHWGTKYSSGLAQN